MRAVGKRWLEVGILAVVGLALAVPLRPLFVSIGDRFAALPWHWLVLLLTAAVTACLLSSGLRRGYGLGFGQLRSFVRYPPVWIAGLFAFLAYVACWKLSRQPVSFSDAFLAMLILVGSGAATLALHALERFLSKNAPEGAAQTSVPGRPSSDPRQGVSQLLRWLEVESPISDPQDDMFGTGVIARRLARLARDQQRIAAALTGPWGCGKTSVLNMVQACLRQAAGVADSSGLSARTVVVRVEGWGLERGRCDEYVLERTVEELAGHIDCLRLAGLPRRYESALQSAPWYLRLGALLLPTGANPQTILNDLGRVLEAANLQVLLFLEDMDRNPSGEGVVSEICSLLDRLRQVRRVGFILALTEGSWTAPLERVCDHIEVMPALPPIRVMDAVAQFREHCLCAYGDIDPVGDRSRLLGSTEWLRVLYAGGMSTDLEHLAALLSGPRLLKATLRRTLRAWQQLHGELDYDDLLVANGLRFGAPAAFAFLANHIREVRLVLLDLPPQAPSSMRDQRRKQLERLRGLWRSHSASNLATDALVEFLFAGFLEDHVVQASSREQSIGLAEPTDYWARLNAEEIPKGELSDQEVLRAIAAWRSDHQADVVEGKALAEALLADEEGAHWGEHATLSAGPLASKLEQFRRQFTPDNVRALAAELFALALASMGNKAHEGNTPAFTSLWRMTLDSPSEAHHEWVLEEIEKAMPVSVGFANDLFHYFKHSNRVTVSARSPQPELHDNRAQIAKRIFDGRPDELLKALYPEYDYLISDLCTDNREEQVLAAQWAWLGPTLLEVGRRDPRALTPQLAVLLTETRKVGGTERNSITFNSARAEAVFRDCLRALMVFLAQPTGVINPNRRLRTHVECCHLAAAEWLKQHPA